MPHSIVMAFSLKLIRNKSNKKYYNYLNYVVTAQRKSIWF